MEKESHECPPEPMDSEDTLFIMYTSGASNRPKGIVHTHAGYLLHVAVSHKVTSTTKDFRNINNDCDHNSFDLRLSLTTMTMKFLLV